MAQKTRLFKLIIYKNFTLIQTDPLIIITTIEQIRKMGKGEFARNF